MKIAIMGYSGAGKSTLAKHLAQEIGVEPLYLDRVHFLPNWNEREPESAREIVREALAKPDWVIDGNYTYLLREERMRDADEIIFLNYPRLVCLARALKRHRAFRGQTRESMADGCIERMNWEFVWWILYQGRTRPRVRGYWRIVRQHPEKTAVIKSDRALNRYLLTRTNTGLQK
ncbi:MAG: AAA family ATPase [Christensenella sp.]|nr:AAA family ATPase [Christensenella sp.]